MELREKVVSIIRLNIEWKGEIKPADRLAEDLHIDSFDRLMILNDIEDAFSINVNQEEMKGLRVVQDIFDRLEKLIGRAPVS